MLMRWERRNQTMQNINRLQFRFKYQNVQLIAMCVGYRMAADEDPVNLV